MIELVKPDGSVEVLGTTHSANIVVDTPELVPEGSTSGEVPLTDVLKNFNDDITKLKGNVKWLYQYGGTGSGVGGGGGGAGGSASFKFLNGGIQSIGNDKYLYISEDNVGLKYRLSYYSNKEMFTHSILVNNKYVVKDALISPNIDTLLPISGLSLTGVNTVIISGLDSEGFPVDSQTLYIQCATIKLSSPTVNHGSAITEYYGTLEIPVTFNVLNRVTGSISTLEVILNDYQSDKYTVSRSLLEFEERINIVRDLNGGRPLEVGKQYVVTAQAYSTMGGNQIPSDKYIFNVQILDNDSLVVVTSGISETTVGNDDLELVEFTQGSTILFNYTLNSAAYREFRVAFELLSDYNGEPGTIIDTIGYTGTKESNYEKWMQNKVVSGTTPFIKDTSEFNYTGVIYIKIYGWSSDGSIGSGYGDVQHLKMVKCRLVPAQGIIPPFYNDDVTKPKWVDFNARTMIGNITDSSKITLTQKVIGGGTSGNDEVDFDVDLHLYNANGVTSGYVNNPLTNNIPALRLSGESYSWMDINIFPEMSPQNINSWAKASQGFTLSVNFCTDKHPDSNGTVFSYAVYSSDGSLSSGFDISLESATCKFSDGGTSKTCTTLLTQNTNYQVDFVCEKPSDSVEGFMKIYVNGVLCATSDIKNKSDIKFGALDTTGVYLGCKAQGQTKTNYCDVNIHNIRFYKKALSIEQLIKNYIINHVHTHLINGEIDYQLASRMLARNFFNDQWECILWDDRYDRWIGWDTADSMCTSLLVYDKITANPVLPVLKLDVQGSPTFKNQYLLSYSETMADAIVNGPKHPCSMFYKDLEGNSVDVSDMFVTLQGTSSMSYAAKNLEIYFYDDSKETYTERLFTPKPKEWLPEGRFTLKADVVDSAHSNNASLGAFINNSKAMPATDATNNSKNPYISQIVDGETKNYVKHTLEGFPIYLFVTFAGSSVPTFMGIYNFNLGRGSNYNMGFKCFSEPFLLEKALGPSMVKSFKSADIPYGTQSDKKYVFSYEFNTNEPSSLVAFQQNDPSIINNVLKVKYGPENTAAAQKRILVLFDELASYHGLTPPPFKYIYDGNYRETEERLPQAKKWDISMFENQAGSPYLYMDWENANKYLLIALAFGMVDSLGKNLTLRSWDVNENGTVGRWWCSFYDMDTALGLNNFGGEEIPATAYLDWWENKTDSDGYTYIDILPEYRPNDAQTYEMLNSRLWHVVRNFQNNDGTIATNYVMYWSQLRSEEGPLRSADYFCDNYYNKHTQEVGPLLFNLDYQIKYFKKYLQDGMTVPAYNDVRFIHGDRKAFVKHWLDKRLNYLDSVMNIGGIHDKTGDKWNRATEYVPNSLYTSLFGSAKRGRGTIGMDYYDFEITSNTPGAFVMNLANMEQRVLLSESIPTPMRFKATQGSSSLNWNMAKSISRFKNMGLCGFEAVGEMNAPNLLELDLSRMVTLENESATSLGIKQLKELRKLNLSQLLVGKPSSGLAIDVSESYKLKEIDISDSHVGSLILPSQSTGGLGAGVLSSLNIRGSRINICNLENQQFLTTLDFTNCTYLTDVRLQALPNLKTVIFGNNPDLKNIEIISCDKLESVLCAGQKELTLFKVESCVGLKTINLSECSNLNLRINVNGSYNLETLNLANTATTYNPILPSPLGIGVSFFSTMKNLTLLNSTIKAFDFGQEGTAPTYQEGSVHKPILDLSRFKNSAFKVIILNNNSVEYIKFLNSKTNPIEILPTFVQGCLGLKRLFGNFVLTQNSTFYQCNSFYLNPVEKDANNKTISYGADKFFGVDTSTADGLEQWYSNFPDYLGTNILIAGNLTSMYRQFSYSSVSQFDVYYILNRAPHVTSWASCFAACSKIVTSVDDPLRRDTFLNLGNATTLNSMFSWCGSLRGPIFSVSHGNRLESSVSSGTDGLFSPLTSCTDINSLFAYGGLLILDDFIFYKLPNKETSLNITNLNLVFGSPEYTVNTVTGEQNVPYYFVENTANILTAEVTLPNNSTAIRPVVTPARASMLLKYLPNITSLTNMFNYVDILFDTLTHTFTDPETSNTKLISYCPLFFNNTKLTTVTTSFRRINGSGSLVNLFGGLQELISDFPNNFTPLMTSLYHSFVISKGSVTWPIRDDMFTRCASRITNISGVSVGHKGYDVSFSGTSKTFVSLDGEKFPYNVFRNCTAIADIPAFFYKMSISTSADYPILLPNSQFSGCPNLTNVSWLYTGLTGIANMLLTSKGFSNCKLKYVNYIFANNNILGSIPYGLFYQQKETILLNQKGWTESVAAASNIDESYGIILIPEGEEEPIIIMVNGQPFDTGEKKVIYEKYDTNSITPFVPSTTYSKFELNNTIEDMSYCLANLQNKEIRPYSMNHGSATSTVISDANDWVRNNELRNTIKYIINPNFNISVSKYVLNPYYIEGGNEELYIINPAYNPKRIILNPDYSPSALIWNEWAHDGIAGNGDKMKASALYATGLIGELNAELFPTLFDPNDMYNLPGDKKYSDYVNTFFTKYRTMNYVCPPDLFRYCKNDSATLVDYALSGSNREKGSTGGGYGSIYWNDPDQPGTHYPPNTDELENYGLSGRIPPLIFLPISKAANIRGVFNQLIYICPYSWEHTEVSDDGKISNVLGYMYPPNLFKANGNYLLNLDGLFRRTVVLWGTVIPSTLISSNNSLTSLNYTWANTRFLDETMPLINNTFFKYNTMLQYLEGTLCSYETQGDWGGRGPRILYEDFFTKDHKYIKTIKFIFLGCNNSTGRIPKFWEFTYLSPSTYYRAFYGLNRGKIETDSYDEAANSKYKDGFN